MADLKFNLSSAPNDHSLRTLGSKSSFGLNSKTQISVVPTRPSPICPNTAVMNSGIIDLDGQLLPGGLPVGSIIGISTPDPWINLPSSHVINSDYQVDGGPTHISNLVGVAFGAHGILLDDSALLIITGSHLLRGSSSLSIGACYSMWPCIYTKEIEVESKAEKQIPLKIAWRYGSLKPNTARSSPTQSLATSYPESSNANKLYSLDWTCSLNTNSDLLQKIKERTKVLSLIKTGEMSQIHSFIRDFSSFLSQNNIKAGRVIIEDPFSPFSKISRASQLAEICNMIKNSIDVPIASMVLMPNRHKGVKNDIARIFDGLIEIVSCPEQFLPKKPNATVQQQSSTALIRWMKPFRLSNHTTWSPPTSMGGVWQVSLNRRKCLSLLPVSLPVEEDDSSMSSSSTKNNLFSCSSPVINSW